MDLGVRVHSCNTCIFLSNRVDENTYHSKECSPALFKGKYTHSLGNKQEELQLCAWSESYDVIGITETWWENSHD